MTPEAIDADEAGRGYDTNTTPGTWDDLVSIVGAFLEAGRESPEYQARWARDIEAGSVGTAL